MSLIERMQHYVFPVSASPVLGIQNQLPLQMDSDAPFRLAGIVVWNLNVPGGGGFDGQITVRFDRPDGRKIQKQLTASNLIAPGNQYNLTGTSTNAALAAPVYPNVLYPANSVINIDVEGLTTAIGDPTGVIIIFVGAKIFKEGAVWAPTYPAKWKAIPYLDNVTIPNFTPANGPSLNNTFTAQKDSDFVWQGGTYTDYATGFVAARPAIFANEEGNALQVASVGNGSGNVLLNPGIFAPVPNTPFSVTVTGTTISVIFATNAGGNVTTTLTELIDGINAAAGSFAVASELDPGGPFGIPSIPASGSFSPGIGANGAPVLCQCPDLGVIIRDYNNKAYSNGYVPAALLFPFLNAQMPGWLYPEIYVPTNMQLYFDINYLYSGFSPVLSPVTVVLGLKGMKVYPQR